MPRHGKKSARRTESSIFWPLKVSVSVEPLSDSKRKIINAAVGVGKGVPKRLGLGDNYPAYRKFTQAYALWYMGNPEIEEDRIRDCGEG